MSCDAIRFCYTTCVAQKFRFKLSKVIVDDFSKSIIKIWKKETYGTCIYWISVIKNGFHGKAGGKIRNSQYGIPVIYA